MINVVRRKFIGAAVGGVAMAGLFTSTRTEAIGGCIPTIGASVGRVIASVPGEAISDAWDTWLDTRTEETTEDQNESALLHLEMSDAVNHVEKTIYEEGELKRHTAPLPSDCNTEANRAANQAQEVLNGASIDLIGKKLDEATLSQAAPFVHQSDRAEAMYATYGENWLEITTNANLLIRPRDVDATNAHQADAFILNVTGKTATTLAEMTTLYGTRERDLYRQTSRVSEFKLARLPMVRYRQYITNYGGPSERSTLHHYVNETYGNDGWREAVRGFGSETQGLRMYCKLKAFNNHLKLKQLREIELAVAIQASTLLHKLVIQVERGR